MFQSYKTYQFNKAEEPLIPGSLKLHPRFETPAYAGERFQFKEKRMTSSTTPRLALPFLQAGQALKNITHNEALQRLDTGLYLSCSNMAADALPESPDAGSAIIISDAPAAEVADRAGQIAVFMSGAWVWFAPTSGWTIWDEVSESLRVFDGTIWTGPSTDTVPETLPRLGLNATATDAQRLAVASETSLFNHDGDSHRLAVNRAAAADTASLVFQTNFSGEAEIGLTGSEGFSLKTSSDGTTFSNRFSAPQYYAGIQSPAFGSMRVSVEADAAVFIATPATGGIVVLTIVSDTGYPQVGLSGILGYDTGPTPSLITVAKTDRVERHGTSVLDGTFSAVNNIGISAVTGGLYLENRISGPREFSLTFLC